MSSIYPSVDSAELFEPGSSVLSGVRKSLPNTISDILVGCNWSMQQQQQQREGKSSIITNNDNNPIHPVDLDLSCVLFDNSGQYSDCIYFNNMRNDSQSIIHTGDNRIGSSNINNNTSSSEEIIIKLRSIPNNIRFLVLLVSSYNGDKFDSVDSANVTIDQYSTNSRIDSNNNRLITFPLSTVAGSHTAVILAKFYRNNPNSTDEWIFHAIGKSTNAAHFGSIIPELQSELRDIIPNIIIPAVSDIIVLAKGETIALKSKSNNSNIAVPPLNKLTVGLGWDQLGSQPIDLDASCCLFDNHNNLIESIYFNHLVSNNGSVRHRGDNRTGEGDGDDESIYIDLKRLPQQCTDLFILVNSYTAHPFSLIKNAYIRILAGDSNNDRDELIRFQLNGTGSNSDTAVIMARIYRTNITSADWNLKAIGYGCTGRVYSDNLNELNRELAGRLQLNNNNSNNNGFRYVPLNQSKSTNNNQPKQINKVFVYILLAIILYSVYYWEYNSKPAYTRRRK